MTAREASERLGIKPETLYAYVSRGLLHSVSGERGRARRYLRSDVEGLRAQRDARKGGPSTALRSGEPVLDSSITEMTAEGPRYRGHAAIELARAGTPFESVAELLWSAHLPALRPRWSFRGEPPALASLAPWLSASAPPSAVHALVVAAIAAGDPGRFDLRPASVQRRARALIKTLAAALAFTTDPSRLGAALAAGTVAEAVAIGLGVELGDSQLRAIDQVLVLMADHELNASTFAARVAASANADPYAAVLAGLATLSGSKHGAASDRAEALVAEVASPADAGRVLHERERRGELVPGFGHLIYRDQPDPRAIVVLETARSLGSGSETTAKVEALIEAVRESGKPPPNIDAAVVALRGALGMPRGAAAGLFAVGRCAGWVAHILEQYEAGFLLRPRARYQPPVDG